MADKNIPNNDGRGGTADPNPLQSLGYRRTERTQDKQLLRLLAAKLEKTADKIEQAEAAGMMPEPDFEAGYLRQSVLEPLHDLIIRLELWETQ